MFSINKTLDRMHAILDSAINGEPLDLTFDESKVSSLESKLQTYLMTTRTHKEDLKVQKERIDQLISDISHQTKTPLSNIMLYSELIAECSNEEDRIKYATLLTAQTEKLNFLISSLVKTSRLENGLIAPIPTLQKIMLLFNSMQGIFPKIIVKDMPSVSACFDLKWTSEALENIIDNAFKYGANEVHINVTAYHMFCKIEIVDNGIGMPEEILPKIFTRFYRGDSQVHLDGVGIGLYLAREIITAQGGYIKVNSSVGKGSTFSVFLPTE